MEETKRFKDPIYGYVEIDCDIVTKIIDTAPFQRLRNIRQTGYEPLYPAALHNRFVHSIGVFYLGQIVSKCLYDSIHEDSINRNDIKRTFELACLLHDVGHSPFSHSGENFYLDSVNLGSELRLLVDNPQFVCDSTECEKNMKVANPHEVMSAIVSVKKFGDIIKKENFDFFSRCIVGYKYRGETEEERIKNCFIAMLNSEFIDVDKLDYLIRDSYVTGYESISIDYKRLLNSLIISKEFNYQLMFHKNALSVIENVVYARDAEKKWIQNHPVIIYEVFLVQYIMAIINDNYNKTYKKTLLCYDSLTEEGIDFSNEDDTIHERISLLSDSDIISTCKNKLSISNDIIKEYFARNRRRHPVWKSEAEFQSLFVRTLGPELLDKLQRDMEALSEFEDSSKQVSPVLPVINEASLLYFEKKIVDLTDRIKKSSQGDTTTREFGGIIKGIKENLKWFYILRDYTKNHPEIEFDFLIIPVKMFHSGFEKDDLGKLQIYFPQLKKSNSLKDILPLFKTTETRDHFFYMYYKRSKGYGTVKPEINVMELAKLIRDSIESDYNKSE